MLTSILSKFIYLTTKLLPKFNWLIIQTYPIWEDNGVAVYEYFKEKKNIKIIWLIPDKLEKIPFKTNKDTIFLKRKSLKAIYYYVFAKYVFITHGLYFRHFPKNQISVNMWHGMPLKRIGIEKGKLDLVTTFTLSTSKYFNKILSSSFRIPEISVIPIGLPRNIKLFSNKETTRKKLNVCLSDRIIFWLPTYRKSNEGDIRQDGIEYGNACNIPDFNTESFNILLEELNYTCFIKPHPMSSAQGLNEKTKLKLISDEWLYDKSLTLYEALSSCDILITDVSSVLVDFLLIDKPLIIAFPDIDAYVSTRGLAVDNFLENLPGPLCFTQADITKQIMLLEKGPDQYSIIRQKIKYMYHESIKPLDCLANLSKMLDL